MAASLRFLPASRGTLIKLRERLELVRRGKNVLEMRRDQLIKEVFSLVDQIRKRSEAESAYIEALQRFSRLRALRGEHQFKSLASIIIPPRVEVVPVSIQGVLTPQVRLEAEPDFSKVLDPELRRALEELWKALKNMIEITNMEIAVERLCEQLQYINRVVNSLEKNLIPQLVETIRHVEERVEEEELGEFVRIKFVSGSFR